PVVQHHLELHDAVECAAMRMLALLATSILASCHQPTKPSVPAPTPGAQPLPAVPPSPGPEPTLDTLTAGEHAHGFTAVAQYLDDAGKPLGARFRHVENGLVFDFL